MWNVKKKKKRERTDWWFSEARVGEISEGYKKQYKFPVIRQINSGDIMYSIVVIIYI